MHIYSGESNANCARWHLIFLLHSTETHFSKLRASISKLKQLQHLQQCRICNKVNQADVAKPSALLIARFKQHIHSLWDSPGIKSKETNRLRDALTPQLWPRTWCWHMPHRSYPACLPPGSRPNEGGGYLLFCTGLSRDGDRETGQAQAWLELCGAANTSEGGKGDLGQHHHSSEFLLFTFSPDFRVGNSPTLPSRPLIFTVMAPWIPNLLVTKQSMKLCSTSSMLSQGFAEGKSSCCRAPSPAVLCCCAVTPALPCPIALFSGQHMHTQM